jgi:hypothetical protein
MSEEIKSTGIGLTISNINHDMMVRKLQSERQARLDAETKLRELQDALYKFMAFQANPNELLKITEAIQESRTRRQNDDTTI